MENENKDEKEETRGRKKIHDSDAARWKSQRETMKALGYVSTHIYILAERKAQLMKMVEESQKPKRVVVDAMVEFMWNNKHLFPRVFEKKGTDKDSE